MKKKIMLNSMAQVIEKQNTVILRSTCRSLKPIRLCPVIGVRLFSCGNASDRVSGVNLPQIPIKFLVEENYSLCVGVVKDSLPLELLG